MKTPLSTIWLLCIHCGLAALPSARGQTTILSEGFEGIFPGEWLVANFDPDGSEVYWGKVNSAFGGEGTHSGSSKAYCAGIGFFGTSANPSYDTYMMSVMARGINLAGYSDATLTFWHKIPSIETGFDDASVLIDNQVIWSSGSPESAWTQVTIPLTGFVGGVHTLAFFFSSDDSVTFEGWYLDDILVTARNAATPPTLRLSPAKGPVGRAVSVSALGFPAGDAGRPALVLFDGGIVATQTLAACSNPSDGAGFGLLCNGAPANTIVPPASDGPHIFKATEGNFQGQLAPEATFVVGPDFSVASVNGITASGKQVRGAPFPPQQMQPDLDENPELPEVPEGPFIPRVDTQPMTVQGGNFAPPAGAPAAPTDPVKLVRNTGLPAAGDPPDPSAASSGRVVLITANTWMAFSTDCGATFTQLDPTTIFPNDADGGICCDQVVQYAPQIDRFIWLMQFWDNPRLSGGVNRYRLAVASPADVISSGGTAWTYWDLTSASMGLTGGYQFMDYPDLAIGANALYITANLPGSNGKLIVRFMLADFVAPGAPGLPFRFLAQDDPCYRMAQNCGTRAYWAGLIDSSSIRLFYWDESSTVVSWNDYSMPSSPIAPGTDYTSLTPASVNWLSFRGPPRSAVATGVKNGDELWFSWYAGRDPATVPAARRIPHPRIDVLKVNATTFGLIQYLPIWNPAHAFSYPALAANSDGEVGLSFAWGGGGIYYANHGVGILTGTPFLINTFTSSHSGYGRWGDYLAVRRHYPETRLFSASGYGIQARPGVGDGFTYDPRYILFGRTSVPAPLCLSLIKYVPGKFSFRLLGEAGQHVNIQGSSDFKQWTDLLQTTLQTSTYDFTDSPLLPPTYRFYRAVTQ